MNGILESDFVEVRPGQDFDPYEAANGAQVFGPFQLSESTFDEPGEYAIRFEYSTLSNDTSEWQGDPHFTSELPELLRCVPRTQLESNQITVVVDPNDAT